MRTRTAVVAVVALISGACAANEGPRGPVVGGTSNQEWVELRVENGTPASLRLYALSANSETSIGRIDPLSERLLRIPATAVSGLIRLVARPSVDMLMDRRHVSDPISLYPGQRVTWQLQPSPGVSDVPRLSIIKLSQ